MKILHLSDIHMGSSFIHGRTDPVTGRNTRLQDFSDVLRLCIDKAIEQAVDLVLFGGDAFPDSTPPPYVQEALGNQFNRLAEKKIPTVLLIGNHDQHSHGQGGASLSIYRTLAGNSFIVGDSITTHSISTASGKIQVTTLPWINRAALVTRPETEGLSLAEINQLICDKLGVILEQEIRKIDKTMPAILLAHAMVDRATFGAEKYLAISNKGFQIPLSFFTQPEYDYVALGHVHSHQNLNPTNDPPVVYPGSIERVDFSEEKEDKGYVIIDINQDESSREINWSFCKLPARPFKTIKIDVSKSQDPQSDIEKAVKSQNIKDAVVRLIYQIHPEQCNSINVKLFEELFKEAHTYSSKPDLITAKNQQRLPQIGSGNQLTPIDALKIYLENKSELQDIAQDILEAAQNLIS
jgi:exonuclease SbcD